LNAAQEDIRVLFGYEVNILADSTLSMPDELLAELDFVIAAIHTAFNQEREQITDRLIRAIENPYVNIIAHPTGRLINERDAVDADWGTVLEACRTNNKIMEINSQPNRLDLPDDLVAEAVGKNVKIVINTDAHTINELSLMRYGIDVARRGFASPKNIVNTLELDKLLEIATNLKIARK
jgi:DNA polymerase (family X)